MTLERAQIPDGLGYLLCIRISPGHPHCQGSRTDFHILIIHIEVNNNVVFSIFYTLKPYDICDLRVDFTNQLVDMVTFQNLPGPEQSMNLGGFYNTMCTSLCSSYVFIRPLFHPHWPWVLGVNLAWLYKFSPFWNTGLKSEFHPTHGHCHSMGKGRIKKSLGCSACLYKVPLDGKNVLLKGDLKVITSNGKV